MSRTWTTLTRAARSAHALAFAVALGACAASHDPAGDPPLSCAALGGRCQSPDLPCPEGTDWTPDSERCDDPNNDTCCVPSAPEAPPDASTP